MRDDAVGHEQTFKSFVARCRRHANCRKKIASSSARCNVLPRCLQTRSYPPVPPTVNVCAYLQGFCNIRHATICQFRLLLYSSLHSVLSCVYPRWPPSASRQIRLQQDIAEAEEKIRDLEAEALKHAKVVQGHDQSEFCPFFLPYIAGRSDKKLFAERAKLLEQLEQIKDETEAFKLETQRLQKGKKVSINHHFCAYNM